MSPDLREFLTDWLAWTERDAPQNKPYLPGHGLCASLSRWALNHDKSADALHQELTALFEAQGLDSTLPFGEDYYIRCKLDTQHLCPTRLAWVREQLEPDTYRGWLISFDYPPIPVRDHDWSATSPDYDCDCDEDGFFVCSGQQVHAPTREALLAEIDAAILEESL